MSKLQPTHIIDKNGKSTTVHKKAGTDAGTKTFADDPNNSAAELTSRLNGAVTSLSELLGGKTDVADIYRIADKMGALQDSITVWNYSMQNRTYLAEARDSFRETLNVVLNIDDSLVSEGAKQGYSVALGYIDALDVQRPPGFLNGK